MANSRLIVAVRRKPRPSVRGICRSAALCAAAPLWFAGTADVPTHAALQTSIRPLAAPRRPGAAYAVVRQDVVVSDFAWIPLADVTAAESPTAAVTGTVQAVVVAREAGLAELPVDLKTTMTVQRAVDQQGRSLTITSGSGTVVRLASPAAAGDTVRVTLSYTGRLVGDGNVTYPFHQTAPQWQPSYWMLFDFWNLGPGVATTSEAEKPELTPGSVTITLPADYQAVNGWDFVSDSALPNGRHTLRWRDDKGIGAGGAIGRWSYARDTWVGPNGRRIPIFVYFAPEKRASGEAAVPIIKRAMSVFDSVGTRFPFNSYKMVTIDRTEYIDGTKGVAGDGVVYMSGLADPSRFPQRPHEVPTYVHELGHNWVFGGPEGEADFLLSQYWAAVEGSRTEQQTIGLMSDAPPDPGDSYVVGRQFYYLLKRYLGDDRFWKAVRTYVTKYPGLPESRPGLTEGFLKAVQETTGEDLTWFVDQWYFLGGQASGWPEFAVTAQYDAAAQRVTLAVEQTQNGETGVPEVFRTPVTVRVATSQGDVLATAQLTERKQTIVVEQVRAAPTMIIFDDKDGIAKRLTFEQPTAWLLEQLKREPTAWQTWWAIKQLGSRAAAGDTVAKAALVTAVETGRFAMTRQQALEALGGAALQVPLPTLRRAIQDSSAQVREAGIGMLVSKPAAEALPLLMQVFETEPTPFLRAASVFFAFQLGDWNDPSAKLALLQRALATPTGDDELRVRTLGLIGDAEMCDAPLVSTIEQLFGEHLKAVLTAHRLSRTCPAFKDALERHRNDARPQVRRWVAQAIAGTVPNHENE